jgi:general secretion pathway protein G
VLKNIRNTQDWSEKSLGAKGFTLIELLVVIIILGVLAAVAIFAVGNIGSNSKIKACKTERDTLQSAVQAYYAQTDPNVYPTAIGDLVNGNAAQKDSEGNTVKTLKKVPKYWDLSGTSGDIARITPIPSGDPSATECALTN